MPTQKVVGQTVLSEFDYLNKLVSTKSEKKLKALINNAPPGVLLAITEIALNVLKNKFPLKHRQLLKLQPFAHSVRKISKVRSPDSARKIIQTGEGLKSLNPLIFPVIQEAYKLNGQRVFPRSRAGIQKPAKSSQR
jgi:hypothetical protein